MPEQIVDLLVEGGQAKAGASLAQPLAPLGINIQDIVTKINEKTSSFKGMKIPVKITVNTETKESEIEVGSPPVSELIKGEASVEKGSGEPNKNKIANLGIEQVIKIAKMKKDAMLVNNLKSAVKSVIGSCNSIGILVEGRKAKEINNYIDSGVYDKEIKEELTEISKDKKSMLDEQLKQVQQEIKKVLEKEKAEKEATEAATKKKAEEVEAPTTEEAKKTEAKEEKKVLAKEAKKE